MGSSQKYLEWERMGMLYCTHVFVPHERVDTAVLGRNRGLAAHGMLTCKDIFVSPYNKTALYNETVQKKLRNELCIITFQMSDFWMGQERGHSTAGGKGELSMHFGSFTS